MRWRTGNKEYIEGLQLSERCECEGVRCMMKVQRDEDEREGNSESLRQTSLALTVLIPHLVLPKNACFKWSFCVFLMCMCLCICVFIIQETITTMLGVHLHCSMCLHTQTGL